MIEFFIKVLLMDFKFLLFIFFWLFLFFIVIINFVLLNIGMLVLCVVKINCLLIFNLWIFLIKLFVIKELFKLFFGWFIKRGLLLFKVNRFKIVVYCCFLDKWFRDWNFVFLLFLIFNCIFIIFFSFIDFNFRIFL